MVPLMVETIYKRLAAADASIPKQMVANAVFGGRLHTIFHRRRASRSVLY